MNETDELQRIDAVEEELVEEAGTFTVKKQILRKRILTIATFLLLIVSVCFGVLFYCGNRVKLDANGKIDIYSLKGATTKENVSERNWSGSREVEVLQKEEYVSNIKEKMEASQIAGVYGTAQNIKMIAIDDYVSYSRIIQSGNGDGTWVTEELTRAYPAVWWIVTFDIDVIDDLGTLDGMEKIHVVLASRYATEFGVDNILHRLHSPEDIEKMYREIQENPTGFFVLRKLANEQDERLDDTWISNGNIWKIKGKEYRAIEFADYFVNERYDCNGKRFRYASGDSYTVYLDELRVQKD